MERLAKILADMLRSALEWEQNNGRKESLTGVYKSYTLLPPEVTRAGEKNDDDTDKERKPPTDLRGSEGIKS